MFLLLNCANASSNFRFEIRPLNAASPSNSTPSGAADTGQQPTENPSPGPRNRKRLPWQMFWALADQGVVSIARMLTSILIGRYGSKEELGLYTLGFTVLTLVVSLQEAMVTTPYTVFVARYPREQQPSFSGHLFLFSKILTVATMTLLAVAIGIATIFQTDPQLISVLTALLLILPFSLLKEFSRRWQVAHLKMVDATLIDSLNSLLLLGGLGVLYYFQSLNAFNAFMITGLAAMLASLAWGVFSRREFQFQWKQLKHTMRSCFHYGKWVAGENLLSVLQYFFGNWFLFFVLSTEDVGNYAGCVTIVMLSNPFLLGVTGLLATRSSRVYAEEGPTAVRTLVGRYLQYVVAVMALFAVFIFLAGDYLLHFVFKGEITGQHGTITMLALAMIALGISYMTSCGLRAVNRPQANYYGSLLGLVFTAAVSFAALSYASPQASAAAFLTGTTSMAAFRCWSFYFQPAARPRDGVSI